MTLPAPGQYEAAGFAVRLNARATGLDRARRVVPSKGRATRRRRRSPTTAWCWPPAPRRSCRRSRGATRPAASSTARSRTWRRSAPGRAAPRAASGAVIGGGLLGLEAANALAKLGLETHVVEFAPRLMALQIDETGGAVLRRRIEDLGVRVHTATSTKEILAERRSRASAAVRQRRRAGRRPRGLLGRHPAARRAGARGRAGDRRARRHRHRRELPHRGPGDLRHRRVRLVRGAQLRPGRARLPDGARGRRRALGDPGDERDAASPAST